MPCVVLVLLSVQVFLQQAELADRRRSDRLRLQVADFERALSIRLERIRQQPDEETVAVVGRMRSGRLVLPWESVVSPVATPVFSEALLRAQQYEVAEKLGPAAQTARAALRVAATAAEANMARLVLARVLVKHGRRNEAVTEYRRLLDEPLVVTDEVRMPFAFHGAERLSVIARGDAATQIQVARTIDAVRSEPLSPVAVYLLRSVAATIGDLPDRPTAAARSAWIHSRIDDVEQALALQRDFATLEAVWRRDSLTWLPFGASLWLVGLHSAAPGETSVVMVRASRVVDDIQGTMESFAGIQLHAGGAGEDWLGERFPGVRVTVPRPEADGDGELRLQRTFTVGALAMVLSVTAFGGFLLWWDIGRESRLAELRSQFVSSVSHELKTPLTAIRMFAETLRLGRADDDVRDEYLDTIVNESERLTRLLNNVLDFSTIERGAKSYHREARALGPIVKDAARAIAYPLEQQGFMLVVEIDGTVPPVAVDADAIKQAILNLLTNAMKYSGEGRKIVLRLIRLDAEAVISVQDSGIGIPENQHARIFEKFYRVPGPEQRRIPGAGLGLTLVDHVVRAHDGSIRLESSPGRGSRFAIHLPLIGTADQAQLTEHDERLSVC